MKNGPTLAAAIITYNEGDNIGDCLSQVFDELFQRGYPKVLAFNSDGPSLPKEYIHQAIRLLDDHDLVFGPSEDGGYYLVGSKELFPDIFTGIVWSTSQVLERSIDKAEVMNLQIALLPEWYDIDTERDIKRLLKEINDLPSDQLENTRRFFERLPPEIRSSLVDLES